MGTCSTIERPRAVERYAKDKHVATKVTAHTAVARVSTFETPPPKSDWAAVPPKASAIPPRPLCRRMTRIRMSDTITCTTMIKVYIVFILWLGPPP